MFQDAESMNVIELLFFLLGLALVFYGAFLVNQFLLIAVPICIGACAQFLLVLFVQRRWLWLLPSLLGALGVVGNCVYYWPDPPLLSLLAHWSFYYFVLSMMWILALQIKKRAF